jgi:hypothetical protein
MLFKAMVNEYGELARIPVFPFSSRASQAFSPDLAVISKLKDPLRVV